MSLLISIARKVTGAVAILAGCLLGTYVIASSTSNFTQTINPGTLAVDIVDSSHATVASPSVAFGAATFSFACATTTGTFGTASERIYVSNPDAADNGWSVTMAATDGATAFWDSAGTDMDFNDPTSGGCADGVGDTDSLIGKLIVDPSGGTITQGPSANGTSGVSAGSAATFDEGSTDSITLLTSDLTGPS